MSDVRDYEQIGADEVQARRSWRRSAVLGVVAIVFLCSVALKSSKRRISLAKTADEAKLTNIIGKTNIDEQDFEFSRWKPFSCTSIVRSKNCDPKWPRKRCVWCCRAKTAFGKCDEDSTSPLCTKCCKILLKSKFCKDNPTSDSCLGCCHKKVLGFGCNTPWASQSCGDCCTNLLASSHCKEDGDHDPDWTEGCNKCS